MSPPHWYKWLILTTTCLSTFAAFGYIVGSPSIVTIFYIQHYNERFISTTIAPVQTGFMLFFCLPALYIAKKTGNRIMQIFGSILLSGGIALTALTVSSWQGLLLSGVLAGIGGGMMQIATTNTIKAYFPGRQIAPFGAICLTMNIAAMAVPQLWAFLMHTLGWQKALLTVGAILLINTICGLTYISPGVSDDSGNDANKSAAERKPKISLIPRQSSSSMFVFNETLPDSGIYRKTSVDLKLQNLGLGESQSREDGVDEKFHNSPSAESLQEESKENSSMWETMKQPQSLALVIMSGLYSGGLTTCFTVMGDYAVKFISMSDEQVANALTIQGALQIVASLIYIFLTVCTEFSAILLHTICMFALCAAVFAMTFITSEVEYVVLIGTLGFFKAFTSGNSVPLSMELTNPEQAMNLYVMKCLLDGLGSAGMTFLAVYIQETLNEKAALYFGAAALFTSGSIFVPFIKRYLFKPRVRQQANEVTTDHISTVNYVSFY